MEDNLSSKGGRARAQSLTPERRREIAARAAKARWRDGAIKPIKATHAGIMKLGDIELACANLPDGRRVIAEANMMAALGRGYSGYYSQRDAAAEPGYAVMPRYLSPAVLKPFIPEELLNMQLIPYFPPSGTISKGVSAEAVPQICEVWLKAREAGKLKGAQLITAAKAEIIMCGLARVGIIALVDEATGYQADRARDELQKILEAYIIEEMRPWVRTFPTEFFRQVYRLMGWEFREGTAKRTPYVGKLINEWVYGRLPPNVLPKLKELNPAINGHRRHKHFQFLTEETGIPHLDRQLAVVTALMRASKSREMFDRLLIDACPKPGDQTKLALPEHSED